MEEKTLIFYFKRYRDLRQNLTEKNIFRPISKANNKFSSVMNDVLRGTSTDSHCTKNYALSKLTEKRCASVCSPEEFIFDQENTKILNFNENFTSFLRFSSPHTLNKYHTRKKSLRTYERNTLHLGKCFVRFSVTR